MLWGHGCWFLGIIYFFFDAINEKETHTQKKYFSNFKIAVS